MEKTHNYATVLTWTGNKGEGTADYKAYDRDYIISVAGKPEIQGSSDPSFRGNRERYNPEELLVASLSSCHMLWYLHLCAVNNIVVVDYRDQAEGVMMEKADGSGYFREVTLRPLVTITDAALVEKAKALHHEANRYCFIASSMNFPVHHQPEFNVVQAKAV
ncbi:OsmC family protein [Flavitalea sp. BT771]|uniref:OsmC family protein n=1 Tax=Flavitalea sp. BT771 TaxID=3063329 RepID=UPI0026E34E19|nr:OsmC family protein [Flavitalea sp. BT771]MDO6435385.1 OsmC family protein [Flavitalea sp. BT771]MDV6224255.1 OsmC family protein [Flavitalea sp. BT771]